jgi:PilZ domain
MQLSDEVFSSICRTLGLDRQIYAGFWEVVKPPAKEQKVQAEGTTGATATLAPCEVACRREQERHNTDETYVDFETCGSAANRRKVALRNLSSSGCGLLDDRPARAGETVVVHLPFEKGRTVPILCRVQNSRVLGSGRFSVGVKFISWAEADSELKFISNEDAPTRKRVRDDAVAALREEDGVSKKPDRRDGRVSLRGKVEFHAIDKGEVGPLQLGRAGDVSPRGLGFLSENSLPVAQKFVARYTMPDGRAVSRLCVVAHCRAVDKGFRIGARFLSAKNEKLDKGLLAKLPAWFV